MKINNIAFAGISVTDVRRGRSMKKCLGWGIGGNDERKMKLKPEDEKGICK